MRQSGFVLPVLLLALGALAFAADDDVLSRLRPIERERAIVISRDGDARSLDAMRTPAPRATENSADASNEDVDPASTPAPRRTPPPAPPVAQRVAVAPSSTPSPSPRPVVTAHSTPTARPTPDPVVAYIDTRTTVEPESGEKPDDAPSPVAVTHDLAWEFAHRYDAAATQLETVPGIKVRSQVSSPFDIRTGAFHGVRTVNGYSALRVSVTAPCGAAHFVRGAGFNEATGERGSIDRETGYIYVGGWGAGPRGAPVDAGIQKSSGQALADEYSFYFKYDRNKPGDC